MSFLRSELERLSKPHWQEFLVAWQLGGSSVFVAGAGGDPRSVFFVGFRQGNGDATK
jgi:hypothetical protein